MVGQRLNVYLLGVEFLFQFFILSPMVHEYGHLIMLRFLGYEGWISAGSLWQTHTMVIGSMSSRDLWLYGFAGGAFQFLVFWFMGLLNRDEGRAVNWMVAVQGLVYAFFEAADVSMEGAFFSILVATVYLIYWMFTSGRETHPAPV